MKKRIALGVVAFALLWTIAAGALVASAYGEAKKGKDGLTSLSSLDLEHLKDGSEDQRIETASVHLTKAHDRLDNPLVRVFGPLPFVGRQLDSARQLTGAGATASSVGLKLMKDVRTLTADESVDRAETLSRAAKLCNDSDAQIRKIKLGPKDNLVGPLRDARDEAVDKLNTIDSALVRGGSAADGLSQLLAKPGRYLLVAANNAEMRNGSGMFLQAGLLQTGNNSLDLTGMQTVAEIDAPDGSVKWPEDIDANWKWLGHENDLRNLMLSPRYSVNAALARLIWDKAGKPPVDGVITVDVSFVRALLDVIGPVTTDGRTINSGNVEKTLLFDQYVEFSANATRGGIDNAQRHELLSSVASAAFSRFAKGSWDLSGGAKQLSRAAEGRHVMIWSADTALNDKWIKAGVSGTITPDSTTIGLVNLGTNKLDQFMKVDATLEVQRRADAVDSTIRVRVTNEAPVEGPRYVLGPVAQGAKAGEYLGMLTFSLPGDTSSMKFDGGIPLSVGGRDGQNTAVGTAVDIPRGNTQEFVLHFTRSKDATGTRIEPSARIPGVTWHFNSETWTDTKSHKVLY